MAVLKAGRRALRMDLIDDDTVGQASGNSTQIRITFAPGWYNDFFGTFQFNQFGQVIGGTLTGVTYTLDGKTVYTLTGADTDAVAFFALIGNNQGAEARALVLSGDDTLLGKNGDDFLVAYAGNDTLKGAGGGDHLEGNSGNDKVFGEDGNDTLIGGTGADRLTGGIGLDTYAYLDVADSTVARAGRDTILDFSARDGDKIDLSAIDAITGNGSANDSFDLVNRFHGVAGELVVKATSGGFLVQGDTDGVGGADFSIFVEGNVAPVETSFTL